jgi:hypothetical protein
MLVNQFAMLSLHGSADASLSLTGGQVVEAVDGQPAEHAARELHYLLAL